MIHYTSDLKMAHFSFNCISYLNKLFYFKNNSSFHFLWQEVKEFAKPEEVTVEQQFSEVYHSLIHSPALETLLNLEHTYAMTIEDLIHQRDQDLKHLGER